MKTKKLSISTALLVLFSVTTSSYAFESNFTRDTSQVVPVSSYGAQSFGSSLGSITQFSISPGWLDNKWQGQSSYYRTKSSDPGLVDASQWSVDITRRLLSSKQNSYLAMGLGWNDIEATAGESSSGVRFIAEGRLGVYGPAYLFGQAALSPWMSSVGYLVDPFGKEIELGLAVEPVPSLSLRAGYRSYWLDSGASSSDPSLRSQTDGFFIGGGLRW